MKEKVKEYGGLQEFVYSEVEVDIEAESYGMPHEPTTPLDFENFFDLLVEDDRVIFMAGGDWQVPHVVEVKQRGDEYYVSRHGPAERVPQSEEEIEEVLNDVSVA